VQRDRGETFAVARPKPSALHDHRPLEPQYGNIAGAVITRLNGAVLLEQNDEWQLQHRYMQLEALAELAPPAEDAPTLALPPKAA
jgi:hypothetical protein